MPISAGAAAGRVDEPQRQIRLARPRRPEDQYAASGQSDAGGVAEATGSLPSGLVIGFPVIAGGPGCGR